MAAFTAVALLTVAQLAFARGSRPQRKPLKPRKAQEKHRRIRTVEARTLHGAAALLALSVLADSGVEHYRGSFDNPGMYTPLVTSGATLMVSVHGMAGPATEASLRSRSRSNATAAAVGIAGTAFHVYNILHRPGGLSWLNLFYSAPVGAPAALSLAGLLGLAADRIAAGDRDRPPQLLGLPAGRVLTGLTGAGIAGTVGEAALLHFRGAFQNPFMFAPVTIPPIAAVLLLKAAATPSRGDTARLTRFWLGLTTLVGFAGVGFHAYGVSRAMGGWRNWSQTVVDGPPLPAPPSFAALSIAGLAALSLRERENA